MKTMLPELKRICTEDNTIDSLIDALILIKSQHGNLPVFGDDDVDLDTFTLYVGDTNYQRISYPNGYIVLT